MDEDGHTGPGLEIVTENEDIPPDPRVEIVTENEDNPPDPRDTIDPIIKVGERSLSHYITAVMYLHKQGGRLATVVSRGRYISRAFDLCEVIIREKIPGATYGTITPGSVDWERGSRGSTKVSSIEIELHLPSLGPGT